jgi:hypothetical protein
MNQNSWKRVCETPTVMVVACVEPWCETYSVSLLHELVRAAVFAPCFVFSEVRSIVFFGGIFRFKTNHQ